jgi:aspartyl protease family protein
MIKSAIVLGSAVFCAVLAGTGILSLGERANKADTVQVASYSAPETVAVSTTTSNGHVTAIPKSANGHFYATAVVNAKAVRFLVDTGASMIALTPADARRLGFTDLVYDAEVSTANGKTAVARITLSSVTVGQSTVRNVEGVVVKEGLSDSLLGMSYLGKLSRMEVTQSSLILHP